MKRLFILLAFVLSFSSLWAQGKNERKCAAPMDDFYFRRAMANFAHQPDDLYRDDDIRLFTASNCLNTAQTRRLAALYANEHHRYDYVVYAADFVIDYPNYVSIAEIFRNPIIKERLLNELGFQPIHQACNIPGYNGRIGGPRFVSDQEFGSVFEMMRAECFDKNKIDVFRAAAGPRLFTAVQIRSMAELFDFDIHRLNFAKAALANCYDLDNYFLVGAAFDFDSNKRDLNRYFTANVNQFVWDGPGWGWLEIPNPNQFPIAGYTGRIGNQLPMSNAEFNILLSELREENFDNQRMELIKVAANSRGFSTAQVIEIAELFEFDSNRYDFAEWAYGKTYDYDNFYSVANAFEYNNYKSDLLELIS
jgi:hypothetical protein